MLLPVDNLFSRRTLVGIGVNSWTIQGEYRCFGLIPYETETDKPFVEVGVITTLRQPEPLAPAMADWGAISYPQPDFGVFGFRRPQQDEEGYPQ